MNAELGYNAIAIPLAAGVLAWAGVVLSPAVGALLMSASTVIVAINARFLSMGDRPRQTGWLVGQGVAPGGGNRVDAVGSQPRRSAEAGGATRLG